MKKLKAYRYRLYPTPEQEALFGQTAGACRFVYNLCLEQRRLEWQRSVPRRLTSYDQIKCGHVHAGNRPSQAEFRCLACGHGDNADFNAAKNILRLGLAIADDRVSGRTGGLSGDGL